MAESSLPWSGTTTGDAGPYSDDTWSDMYRKMFLTDRTLQGVFDGYANELEITGSASPLAYNTGAALVDGKFYENDSSANITVPTPAGATRIDRIVLRKSWTAQTVRVTRIEGVEGGGAPSLTQNDGVTWDIPLYQVSITTGGTITLTDQRYFIVPNFEVDVGRDPSPVFGANVSMNGYDLDLDSGDITMGAGTIDTEGGNINVGAGDIDIEDGNLHNIKQVDMTDEHTSASQTTIDWREGNNQKVTLTANRVFAFTAPSGPCHLQLKVVQDGSGSRTVTWPATVKWARGIAPTLSTGASDIDIAFFWYDGTNYYGSYGIDYS